MLIETSTMSRTDAPSSMGNCAPKTTKRPLWKCAASRRFQSQFPRLSGGLLKGERIGQRVQFGCCRGVGHSGTKANGNLQAVAELDQGIGWIVRGEAAESGEWDPCCFGDAAEDPREASAGRFRPL